MISGSGTIHINSERNNFENLPDYVGKYFFDADDREAEIQFCVYSEREPFNELVLEIEKVWFGADSDIELHIKAGGEERVCLIKKAEKDKHSGEIVVDMEGIKQGEVYLSADFADNIDGTCLVYFHSIKLR